MLDSLLIQRLDDHVAGAVGGEAGAAHGTFAEVAGVTAKPTLVDLAFRRAVEREAHVLQFEHGVDRFACEDLGGVLIDEVVATFDRVEHMPLPVVFLRVAECGADSALGGSGVGTGRIELADNRDVRLARHLNGGHQSGAPGANDDRVDIGDSSCCISRPAHLAGNAISRARTQIVSALR